MSQLPSPQRWSCDPAASHIIIIIIIKIIIIIIINIFVIIFIINIVINMIIFIIIFLVIIIFSAEVLGRNLNSVKPLEEMKVLLRDPIQQPKTVFAVVERQRSAQETPFRGRSPDT